MYIASLIGLEVHLLQINTVVDKLINSVDISLRRGIINFPYQIASRFVERFCR
jgi:hypothetical protein